MKTVYSLCIQIFRVLSFHRLVFIGKSSTRVLNSLDTFTQRSQNKISFQNSQKRAVAFSQSKSLRLREATIISLVTSETSRVIAMVGVSCPKITGSFPLPQIMFGCLMMFGEYPNGDPSQHLHFVSQSSSKTRLVDIAARLLTILCPAGSPAGYPPQRHSQETKIKFAHQTPICTLYIPVYVKLL